MPRSSTPLENESLEELIYLLRWNKRASQLRNRHKSRAPLILIGGWAVYAYNPYIGSVDIDVLGRSRLLKSLRHELGESRGFEKLGERDTGTRRFGLRSNAGEIILDCATFEDPNIFEGDRHKDLPWKLALEHQRQTSIGGEPTTIPARTILLAYKAKAADDRATRLAKSSSADPAYDRAKLIKDRADVLALLDPSQGGKEFDLGLAGVLWGRFPLLRRGVQAVLQNRDPVDRYNTGASQPCEPQEAREWIDNFLALVASDYESNIRRKQQT